MPRIALRGALPTAALLLAVVFAGGPAQATPFTGAGILPPGLDRPATEIRHRRRHRHRGARRHHGRLRFDIEPRNVPAGPASNDEAPPKLY